MAGPLNPARTSTAVSKDTTVRTSSPAARPEGTTAMTVAVPPPFLNGSWKAKRPATATGHLGKPPCRLHARMIRAEAEHGGDLLLISLWTDEHQTNEGGQVSTGDLQRLLGLNLRAYRQSQGLSQEALAQVLQVHRTYMGGLERGERNPTLQSLERIAERLGVEPVRLLSAPNAGSTPWA